MNNNNYNEDVVDPLGTKDAQEKMAAWAYEIFEMNPHGKLFMDKLKTYLTYPVIPVNAGEEFGRMREGENRLIRLFIKLCDNHKTNLAKEKSDG